MLGLGFGSDQLHNIENSSTGFPVYFLQCHLIHVVQAKWALLPIFVMEYSAFVKVLKITFKHSTYLPVKSI